MKPRELVQAWVGAFDRADVKALASFYSNDATNHQVALEHDLVTDHMEETAASQAKRIAPFENGPLAFLKDMLGDTDHLGPGKPIGKHFANDWDKLSFLRFAWLAIVGRLVSRTEP